MTKLSNGANTTEMQFSMYVLNNFSDLERHIHLKPGLAPLAWPDLNFRSD